MPSTFNYWEPKSPPAAAPAKKTAKTAKGAKAKAAKFPAHFPGDFRSIAHCAFDKTHALASLHDVTANAVMRAAFATGYGPKKDWPSTLLMNGAERIALATFLRARVEWIVSAFEFSNGQIVPQKFTRYVETSEWSTLSYYVGQMAARLAADRWLPTNRKPYAMLHQAVFTSAAFVHSGAQVKLTFKSREVPDLLVEDALGKWHLFEAKGGRANYRSRAVIKALAQLDSVVRIGRPAARAKPASRICSYAKLDRPLKTAKAIEFDVVDPPEPPKPAEPPARKRAQAVKRGNELEIFADVAELLTASLQFDILETLAPPRRRPAALKHLSSDWDIRQIGRSKTYVALPDKTLIDAFAFEISVYQRVRQQVALRDGFAHLANPEWVDEMLRAAADVERRGEVAAPRLAKARAAIEESLAGTARHPQRFYRVQQRLVERLGIAPLRAAFARRCDGFAKAFIEALPGEATGIPPLPGQGGAVFFTIGKPPMNEPTVRRLRRTPRG